MKKVLLTTTALAFAGSAFAAEVSGYTTQGWMQGKAGDKKTTGMWTEGEAYLSGSKTASNGLTFGATYTVGHWGGSSNWEPSSTTTTTVVSTDVGGKRKVESVSETTTKDKFYSNLNGFVSGSFGRVDMGYHNAASRSHGAHATEVGGGVAENGYGHTALTGRIKATDSMTYSSPSFNGLSVAYSYTPMSDSEKKDSKAPSSLGVKYMGNAAGMGIGFSFGMNTPANAQQEDDSWNKNKANNSWNLKVSKGAFAGSFGMGTIKKENAMTKGVSTPAEKDTKQTRFGVAYSAGKIGVGFSMLNEKTGDKKNSKQTMYAKYTVASGLTAYVQNISNDNKADDSKKKASTLLVGTTISF